MSRRLRWAAMLALLAAATWLAVFGDKTPPGAVAQATRPLPAPVALSSPPRNRAAPVVIEALQPRLAASADAGAPVADLFRTTQWHASPQPASAATAAPAAASAAVAAPVPPQPYRLIGKKLEAEAWEVFLGRGESSFVVRPGDTLEGAWRVEGIEPPLLTLTHLASGQKQTLDIGAAP